MENPAAKLYSVENRVTGDYAEIEASEILAYAKKAGAPVVVIADGALFAYTDKQAAKEDPDGWDAILYISREDDITEMFELDDPEV